MLLIENYIHEYVCVCARVCLNTYFYFCRTNTKLWFFCCILCHLKQIILQCFKVLVPEIMFFV